MSLLGELSWIWPRKTGKGQNKGKSHQAANDKEIHQEGHPQDFEGGDLILRKLELQRKPQGEGKLASN